MLNVKYLLLAILFALPVAAQTVPCQAPNQLQPCTQNFNLILPANNTLNWGQLINQNFAVLDGIFTRNNTWTGTTSISGCHNIANIRCVDASNNAGWTGSNAAAWIVSAMNDCGANACVVMLNPTVPLSTALPATLPDNVAIWDLRGSGRLDIYSNPNGNALGVPGGIAVHVGYNPALGGCWPTIGPGVNNIVGLYSCTSSSGGHDSWGMNPLGNLPVNAPDANIWGDETDINIFGTGRNHQYIGKDVVNGGTVPPTYGYRVWAATTGITAGFNVGYQVDGVIHTAYAVAPPDLGLTITQNITSSGVPQTITTTAGFGSHIHLGQTISLDSGGNQENVVVTGITGVANWSVTGIFTKNHTSGAGFVVYTADRLWDPFESVTLLTPYHICNLQKWNAANPSSSCGFEVNDLTGAARLSDFFNTGTGAHVWRDVTTAGFEWDNQASSSIATLSDAGTYNAVQVQSGGNNVVVSGAFTRGLQAKRGVTGCVTAASIGAVCSTTVTWTSAFADTSYTVTGCTGNAVTSGAPLIQGITAKVAASVTVQTIALTAVAAQFTNVECGAVHD